MVMTSVVEWLNFGHLSGLKWFSVHVFGTCLNVALLTCIING